MRLSYEFAYDLIFFVGQSCPSIWGAHDVFNLILKFFLALVVHIHVSLKICVFVISCINEHSEKLVRKQHILELIWSQCSIKFDIIKTSTQEGKLDVQLLSMMWHSY